MQHHNVRLLSPAPTPEYNSPSTFGVQETNYHDEETESTDGSSATPPVPVVSFDSYEELEGEERDGELIGRCIIQIASIISTNHSADTTRMNRIIDNICNELRSQTHLLLEQID